MPDRIVAFEDGVLRSYEGGWADMERERSASAAVVEPEPDAEPVRAVKPARPKIGDAGDVPSSSASKPTSPTPRPGSPSSKRKLADDWTNMDVLSAHRAARDELVALIARWEVLFEEAHAT